LKSLGNPVNAPVGVEENPTAQADRSGGFASPSTQNAQVFNTWK
jgi:hypothetical protein